MRRPSLPLACLLVCGLSLAAALFVCLSGVAPAQAASTATRASQSVVGTANPDKRDRDVVRVVRSEDARHEAVVRRGPRGQRVEVDQVTGPWHEASIGDVVFHTDGSVAYVLKRAGGERLFHADREGPPFDEIRDVEPGQDGSRFIYSGIRSGRRFLVRVGHTLLDGAVAGP